MKLTFFEGQVLLKKLVLNFSFQLLWCILERKNQIFREPKKIDTKERKLIEILNKMTLSLLFLDRVVSCEFKTFQVRRLLFRFCLPLGYSKK